MGESPSLAQVRTLASISIPVLVFSVVFLLVSVTWTLRGSSAQMIWPRSAAASRVHRFVSEFVGLEKGNMQEGHGETIKYRSARHCSTLRWIVDHQSNCNRQTSFHDLMQGVCWFVERRRRGAAGWSWPGGLAGHEGRLLRHLRSRVASLLSILLLNLPWSFSLTGALRSEHFWR